MGGLVGQQLPAAGDGGDGTPDQAVGGDTQEGVDVGVDDSSPEETVNISNVGEGVVCMEHPGVRFMLSLHKCTVSG